MNVETSTQTIVETPNKEHYGKSLFSSFERLSSSQKLLLWEKGPKCVLCLEIVPFSEIPLSEVPLKLYSLATRIYLANGTLSCVQQLQGVSHVDSTRNGLAL